MAHVQVAESILQSLDISDKPGKQHIQSTVSGQDVPKYFDPDTFHDGGESSSSSSDSKIEIPACIQKLADMYTLSQDRPSDEAEDEDSDRQVFSQANKSTWDRCIVNMQKNTLSHDVRPERCTQVTTDRGATESPDTDTAADSGAGAGPEAEDSFPEIETIEMDADKCAHEPQEVCKNICKPDGIGDGKESEGRAEAKPSDPVDGGDAANHVKGTRLPDDIQPVDKDHRGNIGRPSVQKQRGSGSKSHKRRGKSRNSGRGHDGGGGGGSGGVPGLETPEALKCVKNSVQSLLKDKSLMGTLMEIGKHTWDSNPDIKESIKLKSTGAERTEALSLLEQSEGSVAEVTSEVYKDCASHVASGLGGETGGSLRSLPRNTQMPTKKDVIRKVQTLMGSPKHFLHLHTKSYTTYTCGDGEQVDQLVHDLLGNSNISTVKGSTDNVEWKMYLTGVGPYNKKLNKIDSRYDVYGSVLLELDSRVEVQKLTKLARK